MQNTSALYNKTLVVSCPLDSCHQCQNIHEPDQIHQYSANNSVKISHSAHRDTCVVVCAVVTIFLDKNVLLWSVHFPLCAAHYCVLLSPLHNRPWWWCRPHPVHEHAQDLRPPLGARPASPPTRQAAQPPPRGSSTNPRPLV